MLESLTLATFADKIGHTFGVQVDQGSSIDTRLIEARRLNARSADGRPSLGPRGREPFSLHFLGPATPRLQQRIYRVTHDTVGAHDIFLVPIGLRDGGLLYEAIFT